MEGHRHSVTSADGTEIGLLTAGAGSPLLLVHGGMGQIERWSPLWDMLTARWRVTAMDRRGRGSSGDADRYDIGREFEDVAAAAASVAGDGPVDVFGHSIGATCALGAAAGEAPIRRLALYEPPGPPTAPPQ
jgi:pimeloyl-ACP methyl ester carboxylesterase